MRLIATAGFPCSMAMAEKTNKLKARLPRGFADRTGVEIAKPYRSYREGWIFRNEKPGPGRFRQFMQFDADTVGSASMAADAEMCMMAADTMEALGIPRGAAT